MGNGLLGNLFGGGGAIRLSPSFKAAGGQRSWPSHVSAALFRHGWRGGDVGIYNK